MRVLVLGAGKTGKYVASVAAEHGHSVHVLDAKENRDAAALTAPFVTGFDVVIDFTTPEAVIPNMRACLANGARMVIGTTGWYDRLDDMKALAERRGASLLYGTNFSLGVQLLLRLARSMAETLVPAGYTLSIKETHHAGKLDVPSGTALTLQQAVRSVTGTDAPIHSNREGDAVGLHILQADAPGDTISLRHEAASRRSFAEGAVRAAEWLAQTKPGVYDFSEIFDRI